MTAPPPVLGALDPDAPLPFGPASLVRAAVAEPVTALLVQRVLVMDVAHPKVAAAVAHHSHFQRRPLSRAWVTVDAALRLVFGDEHTARSAARQIYGVHDHISGRLEGAGGHHPDIDQDAAEKEYSAHDASLLTWVWATLVDSAEVAYTRWVGPLSSSEAEAYYADMVAFARFVGIPAPLLPPDRPAFAAYLDGVLDSGLLGVGEQGRALVRHILWFEHRTVPSPIVRIGRVLAVRTLDPRLRNSLGLELDAADERFGNRLDQMMQTYYPRLPRARAGLPTLYVQLRRPTIGLAARWHGIVGRSEPR